MSNSGSREGFGLPPWDPADPVPEPEDTQTLPGLGTPGVRMLPGQGAGPAPGPGLNGNGNGNPNGSAGPLGTPGAPGGYGTSGAPGAHGTFKPYDVGANTSPDVGYDGHGGNDSHGGNDGQPGPRVGRRRHRRHRRRRSLTRELPVLIVVALVLALVIKTYAIQAFYIPSSSMENTLDIGDRVLINKLVYDFRGIHRGDIVVFNGSGSWDLTTSTGGSNIFSRFFGDVEGIVGISHDSDIYIKRVIGLPGDHVKCCDNRGRVTVNGVPLTEQSYVYPGEQPSASQFSIVVPQGRLWVMGDHRAVSFDSRGHMGYPGGGTIPENAVLGRAFVIIWPPSRWGFLNIPGTFEQPKLDGSAAAAGGSSAALAAAMNSGTRLQPSSSALPLAFGFAGAVPLTWLQALARRRIRARRSRRGR